ncbi:hypothetical protein AWM70_13255 [Paenibacillus yonginensis]|uniref:HTH gntR-type domain-containing protein n=1 Tax=Paenibacillus yonginensis TaxID=1462996 RepID=A0A1B1N1Y8_9BACL|nr:GntR family transcriptional regulator [Paenibacillus yonginensis]ANS75454.1 hypothetical protein AWM70_13255 [Paenibacillus yonginensis]
MPKQTNKLLYQIIKDEILSRIENQQFSYDEPICTEKSLSEQYGVSRITSKRAIDDLENEGVLYRKRGVGSFVRRPEPGESPSPSGTPSAEVRTGGKTVPLILPFAQFQGGIFRIVEAATKRLENHDYHLAVHICEPDDQKMRSLLLHLYSQHVETLIWYPKGKEMYLDILKKFTDDGTRVIILDKPHDISYLSSVVCDNFGGGYQLTSHLIDYGHRNIAYLSGIPVSEVPSLSDRFKGFSQCMKDRGLEVNPEFLKIGLSSDYHMLKHVVNGLYKSGVTAIECENDEVAFNVYMCCRSLSIQVPAQMNITGFDNIEWAVTGSAQITTVDQNFAAIGEEIADLILSGDPKPVSKTVPVRLVPRASTGPTNA